MHRATSGSVPGHESYVLGFHKKLFGSEHQTLLSGDNSPFLGRPPVLSLKDNDRLLIEGLFHKMKNELMNKRTQFLACIRAAAGDDALRQMEESTGSVDKKNAARHKKVTEIIRYLNQHYAEPFSLTEYISAIRIK
ncbi:hypothetical protein FE784_40170, partial [Paenibacillus hemerocallicola]